MIIRTRERSRVASGRRLTTAVIGLLLGFSACGVQASRSAPTSPSAAPAAAGDFAGLIELGGRSL